MKTILTMGEMNSNLKSSEHYQKLRQKFKNKPYSTTWHKNFAPSTKIGNCMEICTEVHPNSSQDFFSKYLENKNGRTLEQLIDIAIGWKELCKDEVTPVEDFFDMVVLHTIIETYHGYLKEGYLKDVANKGGFIVKHGSPIGDTKLGVDWLMFKQDSPDVLRCIIQIKPVSFFLGNEESLISDRINVFQKHIDGHKVYGDDIPYYYVIYSGEKWVYNEKDGSCKFKYEDLVNTDGSLKVDKSIFRNLVDELKKKR